MNACGHCGVSFCRSLIAEKATKKLITKQIDKAVLTAGRILPKEPGVV